MPVESTSIGTPMSIIILTWNSKAYCTTCLRSLDATGWLRQRSEVIVIDNGSADGTADEVKKRYPNVRLVRNPVNRGVAAARNQGIRLASHEVLLLLDVDTVVQPGAIEFLLQALSLPRVGIVGPRLVSADGSLQYTCRRFPTVPGKMARRIPLPWLQGRIDREELRGWDHDSRCEVDYVIGACQMIRRSVFVSVGLLDERIFYGPEDVDFCLRAQLRGWRVVYEPRSIIQHAERRITARRGSQMLKMRHAWALAYYFAKYRYALSTDHLYKEITLARADSLR